MLLNVHVIQLNRSQLEIADTVAENTHMQRSDVMLMFRSKSRYLKSQHQQLGHAGERGVVFCYRR